MKAKFGTFGLCVALSLLMVPDLMAQTVGSSEVGTARSVEWGKVRRVLAVTIQNDSRGVGTATGAALGGIAGSTIGGGRRANTAGAVAGAVAGGAVGNRASRGGRSGIEVTVELESGRTIAVTQEGSVNEFRVGDRVQVASDGRTTRVSR
ncbi:glycine zipper 2TM domain-containing protein [Lysobacter sp. FW306-1B-D06B]|uniref:glycine zipper 2TM domain-containing protein n=1 Tax=Lysobacter sp. FW306-1B-D06B TaxID=3140250 RepID=UPI0031406278